MSYNNGLIFEQAAGIKSINVDAGSGDDHAIIDKNVKLRSTLIGAAGNDVLFGGQGTAIDAFDTGPGKDVSIHSAVNSIIISRLGVDNEVIGSFKSIADLLK